MSFGEIEIPGTIDLDQLCFNNVFFLICVNDIYGVK